MWRRAGGAQFGVVCRWLFSSKWAPFIFHQLARQQQQPEAQAEAEARGEAQAKAEAQTADP